MNSHNNENDAERDSEHGSGAGDDVTLAAGGDVVAQIRAHADKVRRGEVPADADLQIWTADDQPAQVDEVTVPITAVPIIAVPIIAVPSTAVPLAAPAQEAGTLLPNDPTVPLESTRVELAQAIAEAKAFHEASADEPTVTRKPLTQPLDADSAVTELPVVDLRRTSTPVSSGHGSLIDGQETPQASTAFWETDQPFRASGIDTPRRLRAGGGVPLMAWIALVIVVIVVISVGIAVSIATTGPIT